MKNTKKILIVEKCNECRNRVLIEETNWNKGITTKVSTEQCSQVIDLENKYGRTIETAPEIPFWCPLKNWKE